MILLVLLASCEYGHVSRSTDANKIYIQSGAHFESRFIVNDHIVREGYYLGLKNDAQNYYLYFLDWTNRNCLASNDAIFEKKISTLTISKKIKGVFNIKNKIYGNLELSELNNYENEIDELELKLPILFKCHQSKGTAIKGPIKGDGVH